MRLYKLFQLAALAGLAYLAASFGRAAAYVAGLARSPSTDSQLVFTVAIVCALCCVTAEYLKSRH